MRAPRSPQPLARQQNAPFTRLFGPIVALGVALGLGGCCKSQDIESAAASAACKNAGAIADPGGDAACDRCCKAQKTSRGTVYGTGSCSCYNASNRIVEPELTTSTTIEIAKAERPPSFRIWGPSDAVIFVVLGPFADANTLHLYSKDKSSGPEKVIWSLNGTERTALARSYPDVQYGTLSKEFTQRVGPPPPLETGHFYIARVAANEQLVTGPTLVLRNLCFEVQATKIAETPCQ